MAFVMMEGVENIENESTRTVLLAARKTEESTQGKGALLGFRADADGRMLVLRFLPGGAAGHGEFVVHNVYTFRNSINGEYVAQFESGDYYFLENSPATHPSDYLAKYEEAQQGFFTR